MKVDTDKAKKELLSSDKYKLPKMVIFIGFMSSIMFKPAALLAYIPIILHGISLLIDGEWSIIETALAFGGSVLCLIFLASTIMKSMDDAGDLDLYLALIFEKKAFPKFLKSKFSE